MVGQAWRSLLDKTKGLSTTPTKSGMVDLQNWQPDYVSRKYQRLRDKLNLKPTGIHKLRHARASELLRKGVNPRAVQEMLGHKTSSTTMDIYAFVSLDGLKEAVNR